MLIPNPFRFLWSIVVVIATRLAGFKALADDETTVIRIQTCQACPHLDQESDQCSICTCFIWAKARLNLERCPKGFWKRRWVHKVMTKLSKWIH
jgi:hypothetical protein